MLTAGSRDFFSSDAARSISRSDVPLRPNFEVKEDAAEVGSVGVASPRLSPRDPRDNFSYVGSQNGNYQMVPSLTYVGQGQGEYQKEEIVTVRITGLNWRLILPVGLCLLVVSLAVLCGFVAHKRLAQEAEVNQTFDCVMDRSAWSDAQRSWCCKHRGRGCVENSQPYDCSAGYGNWKAGWSSSKKQWCCEYKQLGCDPRIQMKFDCSDGYANWEADWSEGKKIWCCDRFQRGCSNTKTSLPFDCDAGYNNWMSGWSDSKKSWCCQNAQQGCTTTFGKPYDCNAGRKHWQQGWSLAKKSWCCEHEQKGCPQGSTIELTLTGDFATMIGPRKEQFLEECSAWFREVSCIDVRGEGSIVLALQGKRYALEAARARAESQGIHLQRFVPLSVKAFYDCSANTNDWENWPDAKKARCCKKGQQPGLCLPYGCDQGLHDAHQPSWTSSKRLWCCTHEKKGCSESGKNVFVVHDASGSVKHNCEASDVKSWSFEKRTWCCGMKGRGCSSSSPAPTASTTTTSSYDCSTEQGDWTPAKRSWCCTNEHRGCQETSITSTPFNCDQGSAHTWSNLKRKWCCQKKKRGCNPEFNCDVNFTTWQDTWSDAKKSWCCQRTGHGCTTSITSTYTTTAPVFACGMKCTISSQTATCHDRISYVAEDVGDCEKAYSQVLRECPICASCPINGIGCFLNFKCDGQPGNWSEARKDWCCVHEKKGCRISAEDPPQLPAAEDFMWELINEGDEKHWQEVHLNEDMILSKLVPDEPAGEGFMWKRVTDAGRKEWLQVPITWNYKRDEAPGEPAGAGFFWKFITEGEGHARHWEQVALPLSDATGDRSPAQPPGDGFMWKAISEEGKNHWLQVKVEGTDGDSGHGPKTVAGKGFIWKFLQNGSHWAQVPLDRLHVYPDLPPSQPAGNGYMWKYVSEGEQKYWAQVPEHGNSKHPPPESAGEGLMWKLASKDGKQWLQVPIKGWNKNQENPPSEPAGRGFMWKFIRQNGDKHWAQVRMPHAHTDISHPPHIVAGTGLMWKYVGKGVDGHWEQFPMAHTEGHGKMPPEPAGMGFMWQLREHAAHRWEQVHFPGWKADHLPEQPPGAGFMWKDVSENGHSVWIQDLVPNWDEGTKPESPPRVAAGVGFMWKFEDGVWQQKIIPGLNPKALEPPKEEPGEGFMWRNVDGTWQQVYIEDWMQDKPGHPPSESPGDGLMWKLVEVNERQEWKQVPIPDWYSVSANSPPKEPAGDGLMWKFVKNIGEPGEWKQVPAPEDADSHSKASWPAPPTEPAGESFMWKRAAAGNWEQVRIPGWSSLDADELPSEPAGDGFMWNWVDENGEKHWEQLPSPGLYSADGGHPPTKYAGRGFMWKYKDFHWRQVRITDWSGDEAPDSPPNELAGPGLQWNYVKEGQEGHWQQVPANSTTLEDEPPCTGLLCKAFHVEDESESKTS